MINNNFSFNKNFQNIFQNKTNNQKQNNSIVTQSLAKLSETQELKTDTNDVANISEEMRARIDHLTNSQPVNEATAVLDVAMEALKEIDGVLDSMIEVTTLVADGTITDEEDIQGIQDELMGYADEIDKIANAAEFAGHKIFDGSYSKSDDLTAVEVDFSNTSAKVEQAENGDFTISNLKPGDKFDFNGQSYLVADDNSVTVGQEGLLVGSLEQIANEIARDTNTNVELNEAGDGFTITQKEGFPVGDAEGENGEIIFFAPISADGLGLRDIDITKPGGADEALEILNNAKEIIAEQMDAVGNLMIEFGGYIEEFVYKGDTEKVDNSKEITEIIIQTQMNIIDNPKIAIAAHNDSDRAALVELAY